MLLAPALLRRWKTASLIFDSTDAVESRDDELTKVDWLAVTLPASAARSQSRCSAILRSCRKSTDESGRMVAFPVLVHLVLESALFTGDVQTPAASRRSRWRFAFSSFAFRTRVSDVDHIYVGCRAGALESDADGRCVGVGALVGAHSYTCRNSLLLVG